MLPGMAEVLTGRPLGRAFVSTGWYAKFVLGENQKVELLMRFATVAQFAMGKDWDWNERAATSPQRSTADLLGDLESGV